MKKFKVLLILAVFVLALTAAFAGGEKDEEMVGEGTWWTKAAAPYKGQTITGISESTPASNYIQEVLAEKFEQETGIKVRFETSSWSEMYDKEIKDLESNSGIYDFIYVEQDSIYAYTHRGHLVNMTEFMEEHPELVFPDLDLDDFTNFINYFRENNDPRGDLYGLPFEAYPKVYMYRVDLFEDPEIKAAFKKEYGWDLRPAETPDEYTQIAKFFTDWGRKKGIELWGTTLEGGSHPAGCYDWILNHLAGIGVMDWGINMNNWKSTVANGGSLNSRAAKDSLAWWIDLIQYGPPETMTSTWDEVWASLAAGRAAQGFIYGEVLGNLNDPDQSKVVGKIKCTLYPALPEVRAKAEKGPEYIQYYDGGAMGIPYSSKKKEAAFLMCQYITRKDIQLDGYIEYAARVIRKSNFDSDVVRRLNEGNYNGYFDLYKLDYLYAGSPPYPFHNAVFNIIYDYFLKALNGEMSVNEALDKAAVDVDKKLVELGYGE
jgi:multiple sugar transport system substrate-binding protein